MTTFNLHPWNFMPTEILEHVFSFLPVRERHNVSCTCKLWAAAVSSASVWSFTEVYCDSEENEEEEDEDGTSSSLLQKMQPYIGHIRYLKLVLDTTLVLHRRLACAILDVMARKRLQLQVFQIVCYSKCPIFYSGQDILQSLRGLFQCVGEANMQHVDFRQMPFILDNSLILLVAGGCPNLRTLLINNRVPMMAGPKTIVEVLKKCPKLSTLGVPYFALTRWIFRELLRPSREPFKCLELFHNGSENKIPEDCWTLARERHPGFRVRLEFGATVTTREITEALKPGMPICELHFNSFTHMATLVMLVTTLYAETLEKLVLRPGPYVDLNLELIELAKACSHLKEIHCFCEVDQRVVEAFRHHCPHLKKYTLSPTVFFSGNPPMVVL